MKARIKCSGLVVTLPDWVAIDRSYYDELHDETFEAPAPADASEAPEEGEAKPRKKKH